MHKKSLLKRNLVSVAAFAAGFAILSTTAVQAKSANFTTTTTNTTKINLEEVDYDLYDRYDAIEVDFYGTVRLNSTATVSVKDGSGTTYKTSVSEQDGDDLSLDVTGLKAGKNYTVTIKGIKKSYASKYGTLKIKFSIPKATDIKVAEVDYDREDREVSFDFNNDVSYKNAKVVITDKNGKSFTTSIVEKDADELTVRVNGLTNGGSYQYKITGVRAIGTTANQTLSGSFTTIDRD